MLMTIFIDYPNNIACFEKSNLKDLIDDMLATTSLTEESILEQFADSLGAILILNQEEGAWEELFELMEPKKFTEDGYLEPTDEVNMTKETREDLLIGAHNFVAEMKATYPDIYQMAEGLVDQALRLNEFLAATEKAKNDPELAQLLNSTPKGSA